MRKVTEYCRSIWTSLKCKTWKGALPDDFQSFGFGGVALGIGTIYGFTAGAWQRPSTASQIKVPVCPKGDVWRRSWAIIGPCSPMVPWQTSSSSSFTRQRRSIKGWRRTAMLTLRVSHKATIVSTNAELPSTARACSGTRRAWQDSQSTAFSKAVSVSTNRPLAVQDDGISAKNNQEQKARVRIAAKQSQHWTKTGEVRTTSLALYILYRDVLDTLRPLKRQGPVSAWVGTCEVRDSARSIDRATLNKI